MFNLKTKRCIISFIIITSAVIGSIFIYKIIPIKTEYHLLICLFVITAITFLYKAPQKPRNDLKEFSPKPNEFVLKDSNLPLISLGIIGLLLLIVMLGGSYIDSIDYEKLMMWTSGGILLSFIFIITIMPMRLMNRSLTT